MDHPYFDSSLGDLPDERQEEFLAQQRAKKLNLEYANLKDLPVSLKDLEYLPFNESEQLRFVCFSTQENRIRVASVSEPLGAAKTRLLRLAQQTGYEIVVVIVSPNSLNYVLSSYATLINQKKEEKKLTQHKQREKIKQKINFLDEIKSINDLKKVAPYAVTSNLLEILIAGAVNCDASDIHLEPREDSFIVRLRLDGILYDTVILPKDKYHSLVSRIKILAHLRLDQNELPQDGNLVFSFEKTSLNLRVAVLPTQHGESLTLRLARPDRAFIPLDKLGFSDLEREKIESAIKKLEGVIIVSGPTGSGKTTTLYAILNKLKSPEKKIITLEDPIEYRLEGIEQSQIDKEKKYTFAAGLKSVLRQDPDIIMVGEVRDSETAETVFEAALTGHLVLTTMHINSAIQTFSRLLDLDVKANLFRGTVNLIINQRLVRKICLGCQGKKCDLCNQTGYKGRVVVSESLIPSAEFVDNAIKNQNLKNLQEIAQKEGFRSLAEDFKEKIRSGITSEKELGVNLTFNS